jgi:hypothetical protein
MGFQEATRNEMELMNPLVLLAEGARFELADPLRGLRFSRPARSATPSPLRVLTLIQQYSGEHALFYSCLIRSIPRKYGRKASGMMTDPSACW